MIGWIHENFWKKLHFSLFNFFIFHFSIFFQIQEFQNWFTTVNHWEKLKPIEIPMDSVTELKPKYKNALKLLEKKLKLIENKKRGVGKKERMKKKSWNFQFMKFCFHFVSIKSTLLVKHNHTVEKLKALSYSSILVHRDSKYKRTYLRWRFQNRFF